MRLDYDERHDVLYLLRDGAKIKTSQEAPNDGYLVLNLDAESRVVGVQFLDAKAWSTAWWSHPDRGVLPEDLRDAIDRWMRSL